MLASISAVGFTGGCAFQASRRTLGPNDYPVVERPDKFRRTMVDFDIEAVVGIRHDLAIDSARGSAIDQSQGPASSCHLHQVRPYQVRPCQVRPCRVHPCRA